jgi:hypothetical protein
LTVNTETLLRDALAGGASALDVPEDPWSGFAKRERTHTRNRRLRLSAIAVAALAAIGVQTGVVPLPGWAPGIAIAGRQTALTNSPTRGSLAADQVWQSGLRRAIKDVEDPGELWQVTSRDKIKIVYAADVPGHRLALALVSLRFGFLTDQALIWYEGPAGAAPDAMREAGRDDGGETVVSWKDGGASASGIVVVVAPTAATVSVSSGFSYTAAGRVVHGKPVVSEGGLAEVRLPMSPFDPGTTVLVTDGGRTLFNGPANGGWSGPSIPDATASAGDPPDYADMTGQAPSDATLDAALAGRSFDRATLRQWMAGALVDARLGAVGTTIRLRWTGTVNGQPAALITLQPSGGGVLAYAFHGSADSYRQDLRLLLPAAGAERRPIAWRMRAEGKDDRTDQVIVVTPPGTARATQGTTPLVLDASGAAFTTLSPGATASVFAYPAGGSAAISTPIPPFETDSGGLPGDTPKTRIVD